MTLKQFNELFKEATKNTSDSTKVIFRGATDAERPSIDKYTGKIEYSSITFNESKTSKKQHTVEDFDKGIKRAMKQCQLTTEVVFQDLDGKKHEVIKVINGDEFEYDENDVKYPNTIIVCWEDAV